MALDQTDVDNYEWKEGELKLREDDVDMSFLDHLEQLRWHIIRSLVAIILLGIVLFIVNGWYFDKILLGPTHKDFISYQWFCQISSSLNLGDVLCFEPPEFKGIAVNFAESFVTAIKMSFVGGFVLAFPYVFYEIWRFVSPGLYKTERKATKGIVFICSFLFLTGVSFGYFIISPFAINFLLGFTIPGIENTPTLNSVISYMTMFTLPAGLIFELPIVVYFLAKIGLVTPSLMRQYRRHSIIAILLLSALLTPPDVVTQFLIGIPLYILYEISILVATRTSKKYQESLK